MTRNEAKNKAKKMFSQNGDMVMACILVNEIYDSFEKKLNSECENMQHDFTISTKELCEILSYFKKNMVQ